MSRNAILGKSGPQFNTEYETWPYYLIIVIQLNRRYLITKIHQKILLKFISTHFRESCVTKVEANCQLCYPFVIIKLKCDIVYYMTSFKKYPKSGIMEAKASPILCLNSWKSLGTVET